jgi:hypothetical protein
MDKYSIGRAVAQSTTFPICKALMVSSSTATTVAIHPYSTPGVTFSVTLNTDVGTQIIPIQCSSIGAIGAGTVTALY